MANELSLEVFEILATGYVNQRRYEEDVDTVIMGVNKKYSIPTDFLGTPTSSDLITSTILNAIGVFDKNDVFGYFVFECFSDFKQFNRNISWEEGGKIYHPNVRNFADLYHYIESSNRSSS